MTPEHETSRLTDLTPNTDQQRSMGYASFDSRPRAVRSGLSNVVDKARNAVDNLLGRDEPLHG